MVLKTKQKSFIFFLVLFLLTSFLIKSEAADFTTKFPKYLKQKTLEATGADIGQFLKNLFTYALGLAGILAVGAIIIGGIYWAFSGESPDKKREAKSYITSALWGLLLLFGAYVLLQSINPKLVDSNPSIPSIKVPKAEPIKPPVINFPIYPSHSSDVYKINSSSTRQTSSIKPTEAGKIEAELNAVPTILSNHKSYIEFSANYKQRNENDDQSITAVLTIFYLDKDDNDFKPLESGLKLIEVTNINTVAGTYTLNLDNANDPITQKINKKILDEGVNDFELRLFYGPNNGLSPYKTTPPYYLSGYPPVSIRLTIYNLKIYTGPNQDDLKRLANQLISYNESLLNINKIGYCNPKENTSPLGVLVFTSAGYYPFVCYHGCNHASTPCVQNNITLNPKLLEILISLATKKGNFNLISLTGGSHGINSYHYQGKAFDIKPWVNNKDEWNNYIETIKNIASEKGLNNNDYYLVCEYTTTQGTTKYLPTCNDETFNSGSTNQHIHFHIK